MRDIVKAAKALSDETRLRILSLLLERECCVCEVMQVLDVSQTRASRNLNVLYNAGFLKVRREGLWAYYSIDRSDLEDYLSILLNAVEKGLTNSKIFVSDREHLREAQRIGPQLCNPSKSSHVMSPLPVKGGKMMKTVLFICVHNAGRSQMAEAFFNQMAKGKARAISAGSHPAETVNPAAAAVMLEEGLNISGNKPKLLTQVMMYGVERAITMGCGDACPVTTVKTEDWGLEDPKDKPIEQVRKIRDEIKTRVAKLVKEMTEK